MNQFLLSDQLLVQPVGNEMVILDPETGNYFTLDAIGTRMIELFREEGQMNQTAARVAEEFDASVATIQADLEKLLQQMAAHGLAEQVSEQDSAPL